MSGLDRSRWAPVSVMRKNGTHHLDFHGRAVDVNSSSVSTVPCSTDKNQQARLLAYQRVLKSVRRLKWKSTTLLYCHHRALTQDTNNIINNINFSISSDTGKANAAEIMFKADFFEFYALLEKVLLHLLECFDVVISADHTTNSVPPPIAENDLNRSIYSEVHTLQKTILGNSRAFHGHAHRFHANVLSALDRPTNPLHHILGKGLNRQYLGIAKEFRNRWKEVEQERSNDQDELVGLHKSYHRLLTELRLDAMLASLLTALDESRSLASQHLTSAYGSSEVDMIGMDDDGYTESTEMEDAMGVGLMSTANSQIHLLCWFALKEQVVKETRTGRTVTHFLPDLKTAFLCCIGIALEQHP